MCGIAGVCAPNPLNRTELSEKLHAMQQKMLHRGPDDGGTWIASSARCGLANRRLAIMDLSQNGHMPMIHDDETYAITFNGEVYNFKEIRTRLTDLGHNFRSNTDTEVVLCAYIQWGKGCLQYLRGMYAFAIWDATENTLFMARDRLGIKPVYYAFEQNTLTFASELSALRRGIDALGPLDPQAISAYLQFGYIPSPLTAFAKVRMLPPAYSLTWRNGAIELERYWSFPMHREPVSSDTYFEEISALLEESVRSCMVADVPLGAFLSGGLDSSAIVALMRENSSGVVRTCSLIFEDEAYSEASWAKLVADSYGTDHYERIVTAQEIETQFPTIMAHLDQPSIDGINTFFVSKIAHEAGLKVALSGLGGDELFAGYPHTFVSVPHLTQLLKVTHAIPGGRALAKTFIKLMPNHHRWDRLAEALNRRADFASAYVVRRSLFSAKQVAELMSSEYFRDQFASVEYIHNINPENGQSAFHWVSSTELQTYTQNQLLRDTDAMSMAHSLEVRVPFLDHRLVECIHTLPSDIHQISEANTKTLLRDIMRGHLPSLVLERQGKQGFVLPFATWLKNDMNSIVANALDPKRIKQQGILNSAAVVQLKSLHEAGIVQWARLWSLVVFNSWLANW